MSCIRKLTQMRNFHNILKLDNLHFHTISGFPKRSFYDGWESTRKEYYGRKLVGYSDDQMYTVVADVKNYRYFVPFCKKSTVIVEKPDFLQAELVIGFPPISESYTSNVFLVKPSLVRAVCTDGNLFNYLETTWKFSPGLKSNPQSCIIDFSIDFEFKSFVHSQLANMFFENVVKEMENAFILEAKRRYGTESVPTHPLAIMKS